MARQPIPAIIIIILVYLLKGRLMENFTFSNSWWKNPAVNPVIASEIRSIGTTWRGSNPRMKSNGVSPVPNPIPADESIVSKRNASTTT